VTAVQSEARGLIIFLNGTSSSGKSSIAAELLRILDPLHYHLSVDAFNAMRARRDIAPDELDGELERMRQGFHRAIAAMAVAGNNVVVDHVLSEPWRLHDCLDVLDGHEVVFVGVHCSLAELERRELARGDRPPGLAAYQFERVHAHGDYDIEVDTSTTGAEDCALLIKEYLGRRTAPAAFDRLRQQASADPAGRGTP